MNYKKHETPRKKKIDDACVTCKVRGKCCHVAIPIKGHNIILEHVSCPYLDLASGYCKEYDNRSKYSWCLNKDNMFNHGGLPKGCLYLKGHPEKETKPALFILDVLKDLNPQEQAEMVGIYNKYNNIPFMEYVKLTVKNEVKV